MNITVVRQKSNSNETLGAMFIDGKFFCYTLEDEFRTVKVSEETRIPAGSYNITLRREGGMYARYSDRFNEDHPMIWVRDVPNFQYIYIHIGNTEVDTAGCILVGRHSSEQHGRFTISDSTSIYVELHKMIVDAVDTKQENVTLTIVDADRI